MVREPTDFVRERRVLEILAEVLETPAPERGRMLAQRTAGDRELRRRLEKLVALEAQGELERDVELPVVAQFEPQTREREEPAIAGRVGSYEIVGPVARGGMGWVFEAIQDEPRRRVALKVLRTGLDSDSARRRFRLEAEVLAQLRHPAIAQVFEAGTHREQSALGEREIPFFALEFVEGARPIVEYAREKRLAPDDQIDLFLEVCDAVHYGHQMGIVHRDLKPANVLVDASGRPKVIDFGVARVLNREIGTTTRETLPGQLVGTVQYMSPEQLEATESDLDARSDVYSLGVLLFELLCGQLPFDVDDKPIAAVVLTILETPLPRPRRLRPELDPDLEAILLHALDKDRGRRYPSVRALADDLRRFRKSEPVEAKAPGLLHRAQLFARRNRVALTGLAAVVFVLGIGVTTSAFFARRSEAALGKASTFEEALIQFNDDMTQGLLHEMAEQGVPAESRVALLRAATDRLEQLAQERTEVGVRRSLASAYNRLGGVLGNQSQPNVNLPEEAARAYARAEELLLGLIDEDPDQVDARHDLAMSRLGLADLARQRGAPDEATTCLRAAREDLEWIVDRDPRSGPARDTLALLHYRSIRGLHGDFDGMLAALDRAEALWAEAAELTPGSLSVRQGRAMGASTRGSILLALGRHAEALEALELGYDLNRQLHEEVERRFATTHNFVAVARDYSRALQYTGQLDEAVAVAESALEASAVLLEGAEAASAGQKAIGIRLQLARARLARAATVDDEDRARDIDHAFEQIETAQTELDGLPQDPQPGWLSSLEGQLEELRAELDRVASLETTRDG